MLALYNWDPVEVYRGKNGMYYYLNAKGETKEKHFKELRFIWLF